MVTTGEKVSSITTVRIPGELGQWLRHKAVDNFRSLSSEIVARLEQTRRQEEKATQQDRTAA